MAEFRQKIFSRFRLKKEIVEPAKDFWTVAAVPVGITGTVLSGANLYVNKKRKDADIELREDQIKSMNELTEALKRIEGLEEKETKRHSKNIKKAFKKKLPEDEYPAIGQKQAQAVMKKFKKKEK